MTFKSILGAIIRPFFFIIVLMIPLAFTRLEEDRVLSGGTTSASWFCHPAGTFYADTLFWSAANHEVYLIGKVVVKDGRNNFRGEGSFSLAGKVHLLIVNAVPVPLASTVILSGKKCKLTRLSIEEATRKFGTEGSFGAVEIDFW